MGNPSGTAYEVLSAIDAAKHRGFPDVYVFRYPQPPSVQLDDPGGAEIAAQWTRLKEFFESWFRTQAGHFKAAFQTFASTDDFEVQAEALLRKWLDEHVLHVRNDRASASGGLFRKAFASSTKASESRSGKPPTRWSSAGC
jgi:hypothetical protein